MMENLLNTISELSAQDAAKVMVAAISRVGEHGREAGEALKDEIGDLDDTERMNFEEGMGWLED